VPWTSWEALNHVSLEPNFLYMPKCNAQIFLFEYPTNTDFCVYSFAPISMGNTCKDLPQLHETTDNTKHCI
jgi:hypothetical protein